MRDFDQLLTWLRGLEYPCAPPIGVGEFEVLYASAAEVVVWYSPAREGHRAGEVAIPCARLAAAWAALTGGAALDEAALTALGEGVGGGRWLLALLAAVPGARVEPEPLRLAWSVERTVRAASRRGAPRRASASEPGASRQRTRKGSGGGGGRRARQGSADADGRRARKTDKTDKTGNTGMFGASGAGDGGGRAAGAALAAQGVGASGRRARQ